MLRLLYSYVSLQTLIWLVVAFPLVGALANGFLSMASSRSKTPRFGSWVALIGCFAPLASLVAAIVVFFTLIGFEVGAPAAITGPLFQWAALPGLSIEVGLKVDELSMVMALVVTGVGSLIHIYSLGYMWRDAGYARYFSLLNLFIFFMLLLVLADNLLLMFIGWEGVGLCSYLLISFWFDDEAKARAGFKAFVVNSIGDAAFLAGIFLIFGVMAAAGAPAEGGAFNFDNMERYGAYFLPVATWISLLLFAGAAAKSAQIPLYVWLPDAMAGPTPVSALIHAATMVAAGVYMVVRLNFIFALSPLVLQVMAIIGAATAVYAATMALVSRDLKKILAYSTISQLGYMYLAAGIGAFSLAIFHLVTHALFKSLLFLAAGGVIHALGGQTDIRRMGGLKHRMPITTWTFVIAAAALAAIAPFSGFFSKDAIMWQAFERGHVWLWLCGFIGMGLTAFYIFRAAGLVFFGETNISPKRIKYIVDAPVSMMVPMMILATLVLFGGIIGVPETLGGVNRIGRWLGGVVVHEVSRAPAEGSRAAEIVLMVVAVLWSIHFSVLGWIIYAQRRDWPKRVAKRLSLLHRLVVNGYYVDWVYERLIARPLVWFSENILWKIIDGLFVDGLMVYGSARVVGALAKVAQAAQTGVLRQYLLYFLIGAVVVIGYLAL